MILRNPVSFVKSGIVRGYFLDKNPQVWGHLEPVKPDVGVFSPKNKQVFKIASFWHGIAKMSQKMRDRYPSRVFTVNSSTMFKDAQVVNSLLNWLSIEHRSVTDGRAWTSVANSNRKSIVLSPEQKKLLDSDFLYDYCVDGLDDEFITAIGSARSG